MDGKETDTIDMSVSSETPVMTYCRINEEWQYAYEILDHAPASVDMSRASQGLVVLDKHGGDQVGIMEAKIKDAKISGPVQFGTGPRSQEIFADAVKGIRRNVSVGYQVDSTSYRFEGSKDGYPVVRATKWTPYEASFEPIPADINVGVNRSLQEKNAATAAQVEGKGKSMDPKMIAKLFARAVEHGIAVDRLTALGSEAEANAQLDGMIIEHQRAQIVEFKSRKTDPPPAKFQPLGGDIKEEQKIVREYSLMNVIRHLSGQRVDIGFEREVGDECARVSRKTATGIMIPHAVLAKRDVTKAGTSSATIATNLLSSEFIDLLRTQTILAPLGVRFLTGLVGDVAIPKMTAGATGYWVAEGSDITESTPTLGQVTGTPHTCGATVDISRKMLLQSTPSAEDFIRNEIIERVARTIQIAVFAGSGSPDPWAVTHATGINNPTVSQGTPTYAQLLDFPGSIMSDNAMADNMKWAMTGEVWAKLAATFTDGTAKAEHVLDYNTKTMLGFPYLVSEDVGANSLFFGNWASVVVGVWGNGVDLKIDDTSLALSGGLRLIGLQDADVMVRHGQSLAYNTAVTS